MRGWVKAALGAGLVVVVAVAGGAALVDRSLDQERLRRAVIASIERQSGRTATLQALHVSLLPSPRFEAQGLTLGNPDGDPDPVMLQVGEAEARLGIWPLLRHVVRLDGLRIAHARLDLQRGADGRANWQMGPKRRDAGPGGGSGGHSRPWGVAFDTVRMLDVAVSLRDLQAHRTGAVQLTHLDGAALQGERPSISLSGTHAGAGFGVDGSIGPIGRLFDAADRTTPWPVSLRVAEQADGHRLAEGNVDGTLADPHAGRGYDLGVRFSIGQLADLNRVFVHAALPAVQGLAGSLHLVDAGRPRLAALHAQAGASMLPALRGVALASWSVDAPDPQAPLALTANGTWRGRPVRMHGTAGTLLALQAAGLTQSVTPVDLVLETDGARLHAAGGLGGGGGDLRLDAAVADLPALLPGAPGVGAVTATGRLRSQGGRVFRLSDLSLNSGAGDLGGELRLSLDGHPALTGVLASTRLDADRLSRWNDAPAGRGTAPASPPAPADAPAPGPQAPAPGTAAQVARAVPWGTLGLGDLDLALQVRDLLVGGMSLHDFEARALLRGGRLAIDPVRAEGPAGPVSGRIIADASATPPDLEVTMHPLFVPAAALAQWLGQPVAMQGSAELVGTIVAHGETRQALAASAVGHVGVSLVNGRLDNDALLRLLGRSVPLSIALPHGGTTELRCLALHAAVAGGAAHFDTISLRTARASLDGHGVVGLQDGSLDLHLVPFVTLGEAGASMPVRIGGSLRQPSPALDAQATGGRTTLVIGEQNANAAGCDAALRSAREDVGGPAPVAATQQPRYKNPKPMDILRGLGLFR